MELSCVYDIIIKEMFIEDTFAVNPYFFVVP